ncbi:33180_t:CDS:2, partial [Gigaspora margarita]
IKKHDTPDYKHLLSNKNIMKYMYQDRQLRSKEMKYRINDDYLIRQPKERGIGHSVLRKIANEWGPKSNSMLQLDLKMLVLGLSLRKPVLADISIDFENKGYDLPPLDNLLNYCEKLEEFINKLNYSGDIVAGKLYIQE